MQTKTFYHAFSPFLLIDLYFLIPDVIADIINPTAELAIPTAKPTKEATAEIETQPLTAKTKSKKFSEVIPVYKKEAKYLVKNYKPIGLLPIFVQVFERLYLILFSPIFMITIYFLNVNQVTGDACTGDSCTGDS